MFARSTLLLQATWQEMNETFSLGVFCTGKLEKVEKYFFARK